jgi:LAO/AO transport system kinase
MPDDASDGEDRSRPDAGGDGAEPSPNSRAGESRSGSALSTSRSPASVSSLNPDLKRHSKSTENRLQDAEDYVKAIREGDRSALSRAITLIESTRSDHQATARTILTACLPQAGDSIRVAVTGVPGVGKSTFIEALGTRLVDRGHRLAVLAVDPSSDRSKGSILGDKTRMGTLSSREEVFIRPSPTGGSLGGVARKTRETILLCEAAGFDTIFVETVGVGQSETTVHSMVDFFLLLVLAGAGDELQGIKRGIVEMADAIAINKVDGPDRDAAEKARRDYENALRLLPSPEADWTPPVLTCSARTGDGIDAVWDAVAEYRRCTEASGYFEEQRRQQSRYWMHQTIEQRLREDFFDTPAVSDALPELEEAVVEGRLSSFDAAERLLAAYRRAGDDAPSDGPPAGS